MRSAAAVFLLILAGCQAGQATASHAAGPFGWSFGTWEGVRRDGADGSEAPMTMYVEPILGGAGLVERLEVRHGGGVYRGYAAQVFDRSLGRFVRQYVNDTRGRFVRLEQELGQELASGTPPTAAQRTDPDAPLHASAWRSASLTRTRESRLVSELVSPGRWMRTQLVSEDGGETWQVLWTDDLHAAVPSPVAR